MTLPAEAENAFDPCPQPLRVLFAGTPSNAAAALKKLARLLEPAPGGQRDAELVGVLTREDAPQGRKRVMTPSPVAVAAEDLGLPVLKANRLTAETLDSVRALGAEAAVVVAYGAMLRTDALDALPLGWYNLHYSLLPDLRGAAPVQRAIMLGRDRTGVTLFRIDEGLDTGPVVQSVGTPISETDTAADLLERLTEAGSEEAADFLRRLAQDRSLADAGAPQIDGHFDYAAKLSPEDARLDPAWTAQAASRTARGTLPAPGPWMTLVTPKSPEGEKFKIRDVAGTDDSAPADGSPPGTFALEAGRLAIQFADGRLLVGEVQPFGKKPMDAAAWYRGLQPSALAEMRFTS